MPIKKYNREGFRPSMRGMTRDWNDLGGLPATGPAVLDCEGRVGSCRAHVGGCCSRNSMAYGTGMGGGRQGSSTDMCGGLGGGWGGGGSHAEE